MDPQRFDRLLQTLVTERSRRGALRAAALALGGVAISPRAEAQPVVCDVCEKKKKGKCKPRPVGTKCGDGGSCCEPGLCCDKESVCEGTTCGACPETTACDLHPVCGYFSNKSKDFCLCINSDGGEPACSSLFGVCFDCQNDDDCEEQFGEPGVCLDLTGCTRSCRSTNRKVCFIKGCVGPPTGTAAASAGNGGGLRRFNELRPAR